MNTARGLYQRWCELLQEGAAVGREELDWTTNELRNGLRSIEWDLEDLEETIDILAGRRVGGRPGRAHCGGRGTWGLDTGEELKALRPMRGLCPAVALTLDPGATHSGSQPRQVQARSWGPAGEKGLRGADARSGPGE